MESNGTDFSAPIVVLGIFLYLLIRDGQNKIKKYILLRNGTSKKHGNYY